MFNIFKNKEEVQPHELQVQGLSSPGGLYVTNIWDEEGNVQTIQTMQPIVTPDNSVNNLPIWGK